MGDRLKMYYWSPQKIKELKSKGYRLRHMTLTEANREYDLTNSKKYDNGIDNEKIQNKISRIRNRGSSNNTIRGRADNRKNRK